MCKYEETLLSCFGKLARLQSAFFYGRTNAFKPMTLADIVDSTGLSVSTVSRAMRGKYIQCSRGVIPAKLFFSAKLKGDSGERSADEAKKYLRQVIDGEDKSAPLSDAQLSDIMTKNGLCHIASYCCQIPRCARHTGNIRQKAKLGELIA